VKKILRSSTALCAILFVAFSFISNSGQVSAQTPVVNEKPGIPVGNLSGTGVAYQNGTYLASFSSGLIFKSPNGENWTQVTDPSIPAGVFNRLISAAGKFVIVGNSGLVIYSTDGTNWATGNSGTTKNLRELRYLNGAFFATAQDQIITSPDAVHWSVLPVNGLSGTDEIRNITYGNGRYVIVSARKGYGDLYIYSSTTGEAGSWITQNVGYFTPNRIEYLKDHFYIFTANGNILMSPDGILWILSTSALTLTQPDGTKTNLGSPNQVFNGLYDGTKFYFFGNSKYHKGYGGVFSSTDGLHFTLEPFSAYIVSGGCAFLNNKYFQFGNEGLIYSSDGVNYKYPGANFNSLASSGPNDYLGVGAVSSSGMIFHSTDFQNWINKTPVGVPALYTVTRNGSNYYAAGERVVLHSADNGNTWNSLSTPNKAFYSMDAGGFMMVSAGYNYDNNLGEIATSIDGINWNSVFSLDCQFFKLKYINNAYFALGVDNATYHGLVLYSVDGILWSNITPITPDVEVFYYHDVVYDGNKYHLMGSDWDYEFFSHSSSTPAQTNSWSSTGRVNGGPAVGGYWGEGAFAFANGHIVGTAHDIDTYGLYTIYSSDGINWTSVKSNNEGYITAAIADAGGVKLIGSDNLAITVDFDMNTLPVSLSYFTAQPEDKTTLLKWQTESESGSKDFSIEHSTDRINWTTIGKVDAAGNSTTAKQYRFKHYNPAIGLNYYRLLQRDLDGRQEYSQVVKLRFDETRKMVSLHPNPSHGVVTVTLPSGSPSVITVYDLRGQVVHQQRQNGNQVSLSLQNQAKGIYHLFIEQEGKKYTERLIKQ